MRRAGQEALVDVGELAAEARRTRRRRSRPRPRPRTRPPARLEQLALEQERRADVVGVALDPHRRRARARSSDQPASRTVAALGLVLAPPSVREQRAVGDQVRVAADRRGEVRVRGAAEPGVAEVAVAVVGLLQRARARARYTRRAPWPRRSASRATSRLASPASSPAWLGDELLRQRRRRDVERGELLDQALDPLPGRAARGRGRASATSRRSQSSATCSLVRIISCSIRRCASVCGDGDGARPRRPRRRTRTRARRSSTSSARPARRSRSAAAARRASSSGSAISARAARSAPAK